MADKKIKHPSRCLIYRRDLEKLELILGLVLLLLEIAHVLFEIFK